MESHRIHNRNHNCASWSSQDIRCSQRPSTGLTLLTSPSSRACACACACAASGSLLDKHFPPKWTEAPGVENGIGDARATDAGIGCAYLRIFVKGRKWRVRHIIYLNRRKLSLQFVALPVTTLCVSYLHLKLQTGPRDRTALPYALSLPFACAGTFCIITVLSSPDHQYLLVVGSKFTKLSVTMRLLNQSRSSTSSR